MTDFEDRKTFTADERKRLADKGWALPDGSFPIENCQDLSNAIQALGRTDESKRERARAHIRKMAKVHSCELPESWQEGRTRPQVGDVEERTASVEVADKRVRGVIPYGVQSRDLGGFTEVIEPTAFRATKLDELRAVIDHQGVPLGRYPNTLDVEDRSDGLHWSLDPPRSRQDVVEAIERGDMRAGSWRMRVGRDEWRGDVRHVHEIAELRDVTIVGAEEPAYGEAARVEYRTHNDGEHRQKGAEMASQNEQDGAADRSAENDNQNQTEERATENAVSNTVTTTGSPGTFNVTSGSTGSPAGSLRVEDRAGGAASRGLAEEFRTRGFPTEEATIPWDAFEQRAVTWTGSVDNINKAQAVAGPYGYDQRWAWPAFQRVPVDAGATSVDVFTQTARTLATAANVVRAIDAVSAKPESASTLTIVTTALKQVASIYTNVPNIQLEQPAFNTVIEQDLTLAINDGLDKLVLDFIATCGFQPPASDPLLLSVRKAMTTIQGNGYNPDTLVLTPANAEALDTLVSGIAGGTNDYVFAPAQLAPQNIYGLSVRVSKTVPAAAVVDSRALGKLYASPVTLARFEADSGTTNRGNVRMELHAVFGGERTGAAVRIAAS